jgi:hypothetical protein
MMRSIDYTQTPLTDELCALEANELGRFAAFTGTQKTTRTKR